MVLRWDIQRGIVVMPKSSNLSRQKENLDIFDFELSEEDMKRISSLNKNQRVGSHPDEITFSRFFFHRVHADSVLHCVHVLYV